MAEFEDVDLDAYEEELEASLANSDTVTKYQEAARIANLTLGEIVAMVSFNYYSILLHYWAHTIFYYACISLFLFSIY